MEFENKRLNELLQGLNSVQQEKLKDFVKQVEDAFGIKVDIAYRVKNSALPGLSADETIAFEIAWDTKANKPYAIFRAFRLQASVSIYEDDLIERLRKDSDGSLEPVEEIHQKSVGVEGLKAFADLYDGTTTEFDKDYYENLIKVFEEVVANYKGYIKYFTK